MHKDHQLKIEVHDMSNLLMRMDVYINRTNQKLVRSTMDVVLDCFSKIKKEVYGIDEGTEMVSIAMGERFDQLTKSLPKLEEVYGLKVTIGYDHCKRIDRIFVPENAPEAIFTNIIQNSSKAGATEVEVLYLSTSHYVQIMYVDNGKGMTKEEVENLGFATTGQGIHLIRNLVHASGGTVCWESIPGKGTKTIVKLRKDNGSCSRPQS